MNKVQWACLVKRRQNEENDASAMDSSILQRLKRETQACHADLERRVDVLNRVQTVAGYRRLLQTFYGVYCPLEAEILRSKSEIAQWLPDIEDRMRTGSLRRDLNVLDSSGSEDLPLAPTSPLRSLADQFGCLYVLEGSTLGGQFIARDVRANLNYTPENGCAFFASYGANIGTMWRKFREAIEAYAASQPDRHDTIIHSAVATFQTFGDWIDHTS